MRLVEPWLWEVATLKVLPNFQPHEFGELVIEIVDDMPEPYRSLLEMRYWERLKYREIADVMGWESRGNAHYHVKKAERLFSRRFEQNLRETQEA